MTQPLLPGYQIPNYWPHGYWQVNNQYWPHFAAPPPVGGRTFIWIEKPFEDDDDEVLLQLV